MQRKLCKKSPKQVNCPQPAMVTSVAGKRPTSEESTPSPSIGPSASKHQAGASTSCSEAASGLRTAAVKDGYSIQRISEEEQNVILSAVLRMIDDIPADKMVPHLWSFMLELRAPHLIVQDTGQG